MADIASKKYGYAVSGPIDCNIDVDASHLAGKTAIVTGGANGLGEAYVRALVAAKVSVCIADKNSEDGKKLASELKGTKFVQCDITSWEDQTRLFSEAAAFSPTGKIHYVVANAGIAGEDDVFSFDGYDKEPTKPSLPMIDVNICGALYTIKLALHYFIKQNGTSSSPTQEDTALVLISSGAGFVDVPRRVQYCCSKWGMRGIMHSLRRSLFHCGSRVNVIAPWYVRTKILSEEAFKTAEDSGVVFATTEEAQQCLLRILGDSTVNGHTLFLSGKKWAPRGYLDLGLEDFPESELLQDIQKDQIMTWPAETGLF